jgi:hypothetical protein
MADTLTLGGLATALPQAAAEIEQTLDALLPAAEGAEARLYDAMRYAAMGGGKRMRGFLVMEGARQFGVSRASALRVAGAIELLHAYSLVHDDLPAMDDDDLRRGKPRSWRAMRCRPKPSRCWPMRTRIPTAPSGSSWCAAWRVPPAHGACAAGRCSTCWPNRPARRWMSPRSGGCSCSRPGG